MRYLLLHYFDESVLSAPGDDGDVEVVEEHELEDWIAQAEASGAKLYGGRLRPTGDAKTIRARGGELIVTDGPFAETKEQIAGFDVLDCATLAEAIELAARHPTARAGTFELRPFWD
jgi:hypothetical protein